MLAKVLQYINSSQSDISYILPAAAKLMAGGCVCDLHHQL